MECSGLIGNYTRKLTIPPKFIGGIFVHTIQEFAAVPSSHLSHSHCNFCHKQLSFFILTLSSHLRKGCIKMFDISHGEFFTL